MPKDYRLEGFSTMPCREAMNPEIRDIFDEETERSGMPEPPHGLDRCHDDGVYRQKDQGYRWDGSHK